MTNSAIKLLSILTTSAKLVIEKWNIYYDKNLMEGQTKKFHNVCYGYFKQNVVTIEIACDISKPECQAD